MKSPNPSSFGGAVGAQWARVNPRERKLLTLLVFAALIVLLVETFGWMQAASARKLAAQTDLNQALQTLRQARGGAAGAQIDEVKDWSWLATSAPVGRVIVQDRLGSLADAAGLVGVEIKSVDKIEHIGNLDFVRLDVSAPFAWPSFVAFLQGLASTNKGFVVDSLIIQDGDKAQMKMVLKMPILVSAEPVA